MDYTQLIERLNDAAALPTGLYAEAAQAIEALQARVAELQTEVYKATHRADSFETTNETLKHMKAALQVSADKYESERDAALAKLKELEAQEPVGAVLQSATNYDSTWSFICSSKQYLKTGIPIYARPMPAESTARTYMDGYSDGKQWALEAAAKVCDEHAQLCEREHGHTTMFGGVRADNAKGLASEIRKLGEGL